MKRWHIGLLGSLLLLTVLAGAAMAQPADVPPGHWAYRAVQTMVERGYMDTDPTGAFNGADAAQRFDVAAAVARLLEDVEAGRVRIASGADTEMLRALEQEFRAELVQWYGERDRLEAAHAQTQRHIAVVNEQLGLLLVAMDDLHDALQSELQAGLRAEANRTDGRLAEVDGRIDEVDLRLGALKDEFDIFSAGTDDRFDTLTGDVNDRLNRLQQAVNEALDHFGAATGAQLDEQGGALAELQRSLARVQAAVDRQGELLEDLDLNTANRFADLEAGWFARFGSLQADLAELEARGDELAAGLAEAKEDVRHTQHLLLDFVIELRNELETLESRNGALQSQIRELVADFVAVRTQLNEVQGRVTSLEGAVGDLRGGLADVEASVGGVVGDVAVLRGDVDGLQGELSDLHDVLGTSEEQIARMTERVRVQLEDQLALSLAREQRLERQLTELRAEFDSYKAKAEEELKSARNMGSLALGAAALAILLGLTN